MYKLCFYVPESHLDVVKQAVFEAGAGAIGAYDSCCWQTLGTGQFRPMQDSKPFIGQLGTLEQLPEYRVELVCSEDSIKEAVASLKRAHPYEEPAYDVWRLADF